METFINSFEETIKTSWNSIAVTDYDDRKDFTYGAVAGYIEELHRLWSAMGLQKGDKIAIYSNNNSMWVMVFMAIVTGGYVAVLIPTNIETEDSIRLINHSDSKILYTSFESADLRNLDVLTNLLAVFDIRELKLVSDRHGIREICDRAETDFHEKYPHGIHSDDISYPEVNKEDVCTIIYTSGTSGRPKGVMLSVNYWTVNLLKIWTRNLHHKGDNVICIAPFYHILGLGTDLLAGLCKGQRHVTVSKFASPNIMAAIQEYKPRKIFSPPILLIKLVENLMDRMGHFDENDANDCEKLNFMLTQALGGNLEAFMSAGASLDPTVETMLIDKLHFPLIIGYGSTESGGDSLGIPGKQKVGSCGTVILKNKVRVLSEHPESVPGEIQVHKDIVFSGYYKDPEATKAAFTEDGWFKTGDMGIIDEEGNLFLTGRCKEMLLTSNGENIYPEKIENVLNSLPYIAESLLLQRGEKFHAIIVVDKERLEKDQLGSDALARIIDADILEANKHMPGFAIINTYEICEEPLERTPKGSLKRYLYM